MKNLILIMSAIAFTKAIQAQDLIVLNDSSKVTTVIKEISTDLIKYQRAGMPEGPNYIMDKKMVAYVVFKNGVVDRYTVPQAPQQTAVDLASFNLDGSQPQIIRPTRSVNKSKEHLYKGKNYIGFNHLALLNSNISLTYMRDFAKEKLILNIPVSVGIGKPDITNSVYGQNYLHWGNKNSYNIMQYQFGAGLLFSPSFGSSVNFLIGPSFSFSQYAMSTEAKYLVPSSSQPNQYTTETFKNDFTLYRQMYGGSLGFLFRISQKLNMSLIANLGCKKDSYNEKDPFGIDVMNSKTNYQQQANTNVLPYANFSWTIGYRF